MPDKMEPASRMAQSSNRGEKLSCGCCRGPENDRCICWMHQDVPWGLVPHKCSLHSPPEAQGRIE
jgi:hypothetical protein